MAINTASSIAEKRELKITDVANALLQSDYDFFADNLQDIYDYREQNTEIERKREQVVATAIIKFRVVDDPDDWGFEDTVNPVEIPPLLVGLVADFGRNEQFGWVEDLPAESTETE